MGGNSRGQRGRWGIMQVHRAGLRRAGLQRPAAAAGHRARVGHRAAADQKQGGGKGAVRARGRGLVVGVWGSRQGRGAVVRQSSES